MPSRLRPRQRADRLRSVQSQASAAQRARWGGGLPTRSSPPCHLARRNLCHREPAHYEIRCWVAPGCLGVRRRAADRRSGASVCRVVRPGCFQRCCHWCGRNDWVRRLHASAVTARYSAGPRGSMVVVRDLAGEPTRGDSELRGLHHCPSSPSSSGYWWARSLALARASFAASVLPRSRRTTSSASSAMIARSGRSPGFRS